MDGFESSPLKLRRTSVTTQSDADNLVDGFLFDREADKDRRTCLLCWTTVNGDSLQCHAHFIQKHAVFDREFPKNSIARSQTIAALRQRLQDKTKAKCIVAQPLLEISNESRPQECWKQNDGNIIVNDDVLKKMKSEYTQLKTDRESFSFSDSESCERMMCVSKNIFDQLISCLRLVRSFSMSIDDDGTDNPQLCVMVRFYCSEKNKFVEELLTVVSFTVQAQGIDIFNVINDIFAKARLNWPWLDSITVGDSSSMSSAYETFLGLVRSMNPNVIFYRSIAHQAAMACKLSAKAEDVIDTVLEVVTCLQTCPVASESVKTFVEEVWPDCDDFSHFSKIRWLTKKNLMDKFLSARHEIVKVLQENEDDDQAQHLVTDINETGFICLAAFVSDIGKQFATLFSELEKPNIVVSKAFSAILVYEGKLDAFIEDVKTKELLNFPTLKQHLSNEVQSYDFSECLSSLHQIKEKFGKLMSDFRNKEDLFFFLNDPFTVETAGLWVLEAKCLFRFLDDVALQLECAALHSDSALKDVLCHDDITTFWVDSVPSRKYPVTRELCFRLLSMFGTTSACESALSLASYLEVQNSCTSHSAFEASVRLLLTNYLPDFAKAAENFVKRSSILP